MFQSNGPTGEGADLTSHCPPAKGRSLANDLPFRNAYCEPCLVFFPFFEGLRNKLLSNSSRYESVWMLTMPRCVVTETHTHKRAEPAALPTSERPERHFCFVLKKKTPELLAVLTFLTR